MAGKTDHCLLPAYLTLHEHPVIPHIRGNVIFALAALPCYSYGANLPRHLRVCLTASPPARRGYSSSQDQEQ